MKQLSSAPTDLNPIPCSGSTHRQRGFAMLLVIVALAVVTVSTAAYLAGRLNAPDASANVGRAVKARVAAETGLNLATAILESDTVDWRTAHVNGVLLDNFDFGQGTITITVADLDGNPPSAATSDIILTAEGTAEGLVQFVEAEISVPPSSAEIQLDLGEFALFASDTVDVRDSYILRWSYSPDAPLNKPLRMGTNTTSNAALQLDWGTRMSPGYYYTLAGASDFLLADSSGMLNPPKRVNLSESNPIPIPACPIPDTSNYTLYPIYHPNISNGEWPLTESTGIGGNLTVNDFANVVMATPDISLLVNGDLNLLNGGDIFISAPVTIVVNGDLTITNYASIEIQNGGSLELFVNGDIYVDGGSLGLVDTVVFDLNRDPREGIAFYQDPSRLKVYQMPTSNKAKWTIINKGYACATLYGPDVSVLVRQNSAVFGNIVAHDIMIRERSALFYDSALDTGWGYTNPKSFIYTADGNYDTNVTTAATDLEDTTINDIELYVTGTSSLFESKKEWKKIRKHMKRYGMRRHEDDDEDDD